MQIILSQEEIKKALSNYLAERVGDPTKKVLIKSVKLRRKSPQSEDAGSATIEIF